MSIIITEEEFNNSILHLLGMTVSLPWKGYGTALFLELGELQIKGKTHQNHPNGEACIIPNWEWRIEKNHRIICGSSNSLPKIDNSIKQLQGLVVNTINLDGNIPELIICFSNNYLLRTMSLVNGEPGWYIKDNKGKYLSYERGAFILSDGDEQRELPTAEEVESDQLALDASERWGVPVDEPIGGNCNSCKFFVRIDGDSYLLGYGICILAESKFDGHIVSQSSGCPKFSAK